VADDVVWSKWCDESGEPVMGHSGEAVMRPENGVWPERAEVFLTLFSLPLLVVPFYSLLSQQGRGSARLQLRIIFAICRGLVCLGDLVTTEGVLVG